MYHFVEDKEFLKRVQESCVTDLNQLTKLLLEEGISSQFILVGSGARNMETQNENGDIDLDYNLVIQKCANINDCRTIKETVRKALNKIMNEQGLRDVQDSTSSLTTEKLHFNDCPKIQFSMDVCIVAKGNDGSWHRLIHEKTGISYMDRYYWNEAPNSADVSRKAYNLKANNLWLEVRECYKDKKNLYLRQNDHNHPSFICYIEAVNEVYGRYKWTNK